MPGKPAAQRPTLSIGALSRATGIPVNTLRTWETRYGFPTALRGSSGHRLYSVDIVPRLRRIKDALATGLRAGDVVAISDTALAQLVDAVDTQPPEEYAPAAAATTDALLQMTRDFDIEAITRVLGAESVRLPPLAFLRHCIVPLVVAVGEAWAAGKLDIHHEHLLAERIGDLLRSMRLRWEERASGPSVVFATLPGEQHVIGLQMAALLFAVEGCRVVYLGAQTPVADVVTAAVTAGASAVAVSISPASRSDASRRALVRLRQKLPRAIDLLAGGGGAPPVAAGIQVLKELDEVHAAALALRSRR